MTDGALHPATVQLWLAALTVLTLAALGIAAAAIWRLNHLNDAPAPTPVISPSTAPIPHPPAPPQPQPVTDSTIPISDAIDEQLARFNFAGGQRP